MADWERGGHKDAELVRNMRRQHSRIMRLSTSTGCGPLFKALLSTNCRDSLSAPINYGMPTYTAYMPITRMRSHQLQRHPGGTKTFNHCPSVHTLARLLARLPQHDVLFSSSCFAFTRRRMLVNHMCMLRQDYNKYDVLTRFR